MNGISSGSIFEISPKDIQGLSDTDAVCIFRELLGAEAHKHNLCLSDIHISDNIKEPDGGIDAYVNFPHTKAGKFYCKLFKDGKVSYQIKTAKEFKSFAFAAIYKEVLGVTKEKGEKLLSCGEPAEKIKKCLKFGIKKALKNNQYYILVSFASQDVGDKKNKAIELMKKISKKCGYKNPKIDIFDATNLSYFINVYPAIIPKIKPIPPCESCLLYTSPSPRDRG